MGPPQWWELILVGYLGGYFTSAAYLVYQDVLTQAPRVRAVAANLDATSMTTLITCRFSHQPSGTSSETRELVRR